MPKEPQSSHGFAASPSGRPASSSSVAPYTRNTNALAPTASSSTAASVIARSAAVSGGGGNSGGSSSGGGHDGPPRLTVNNVSSFRPRVKRLPPDANTKAAVSTQLYQFSERVCFGCAKCRRDNIQSDCVAIDLTNRIMLCTACFTRIIRPRTYTPSRVVPFPSLLSWLNYKPATVMEMSDDVLQRPAEAVAPSGERMAAPMLTGGDRATNLGKLPAIAMKMAAGGRGGGGSGAAGNARRRGAGGVVTMDDALAHGSGGTHATHPCKRVWGVCQHGETCLFRNAPADLCLAYLMGLCKGHGSPLGLGNAGRGGGGGGRVGRGGGRGGGQGGRGGRGRGGGAGGRGGGNRRDQGNNNNNNINRGRGGGGGGGQQACCRLLHQEVYDLPNTADPAPAVRYEGDLEDADGEWAAWVRRRRESPNSAEWQLWHNGPLEQLFRAYIPARRRPLPPKPKVEATKGATPVEDEEGVKAEGEGDAEAEPTVREAEGEEEEPAEGGVEGGGGEGEGEEEEEEEEQEEGDINEEEHGEGEEDEEDYEGDDVPPPPAPTKLSLLDIMSALKGMKKEAAPAAPEETQQPENEEVVEEEKEE